MNRSLTVDVRKKTWPKAPKLPSFPSSFHKGIAHQDINIPSMLLMIGYLTTPTSSTGVSLSEFWAWVRYLAAVTEDADLRLTKSFADLDAHQKTILSDDFGMGAPMLWLSERLSFELIVDGYYFMKKFAASASATQKRSAKRGPNKTPDFVARDTSGVWHVVECKGTQSGAEYGLRQLGEVGPPRTGGVAQKRSIIFPTKHTGQRLVCGLDIGIENRSTSRLTIIDPEPEEPFRVEGNQLYLADDAASRGVVSKALRLSGFEVSAEATASPLGVGPSATRRATSRSEELRQKYVAERDERAREELGESGISTTVFDENFRGRQLRFDLPRPVNIDDAKITRVTVRQGVRKDVLDQLRESPTIPDPQFSSHFSWASDIGKTTVKGDNRTASFRIGDLFRSDIILE